VREGWEALSSYQKVFSALAHLLCGGVEGDGPGGNAPPLQGEGVQAALALGHLRHAHGGVAAARAHAPEVLEVTWVWQNSAVLG